MEPPVDSYILLDFSTLLARLKELTKKMLLLVDLVLFTPLLEIFLITLFCSLFLLQSRLDFQSLKVQTNRRYGGLFVTTAGIKLTAKNVLTIIKLFLFFYISPTLLF